MKNTPLLIATHNAGKLREIAELVAPFGFDVSCAADHDVPEPIEDGDTFEANAAIKSEHSARCTGMLSLADDSGISVPALDGQPGIYSARWATDSKDFSLAMQRIYDELKTKHIEPEGADAYFVCVLALSAPDQETLYFRGEVHGHLTFPARGKHGFGYDPIFVAQGKDQTFGEMSAADKHLISHRARAFALLVDHFNHLGKTS